MLFRTLPTTLLQIFCKIILNTQVIVKNVIDPNYNFSRNSLECLDYPGCGEEQAGAYMSNGIQPISEFLLTRVVWIPATLENNIRLRHQIKKHLKESSWLAFHRHFSFKCVPRDALIVEISPNYSSLFWPLQACMGLQREHSMDL